ncbi:Short-chain dehydrogenase/reductase family 16C member 6-like protein [Dinothrombium tinctorium]|uniref:Short-chain dehydrogenase/reductase 3 n=1 Tax=Dinothrombium tinctorium TaxID=1965070 RepID=A0A3S3SR17_9ACAR|nr:Short-chain dehydrogenase/reductase family 16C member 6-like protein [Dinothrombium tinctorium]
MQDSLTKIKFIILLFYYWGQAIFTHFIPRRLRFKKIDEEIVLITGAGSGLGRILATKLSKSVSHLILWDLNEIGLNETAKLVREEGGSCSTYVVDVSNRHMVYETADRMSKEVGAVSMVINNAGIVNGKELLQLPNDKIVKTFEVNVLAHYWICKAFIPNMMKKNKGHIVTISSVVGFFGASNLSDYAGSKYAATRFHECLQLELLDAGYDGINFTLVCPYFMNTKMFEGAKALILSNQKVEYVADEIIAAIRTNQTHLYLPKPFYIIHTIKSLLPTRSLYALNTAMGGRKAMSDFVGGLRK